MLVQHKKNNGKGFFYIGEEDNRLAEITYTMPSPVKMIIDHTEVSDERRGKNAGYELVAAVVEYARANSIKIIPLCPYADSVFKKKTEFHDVLSQT